MALDSLVASQAAAARNGYTASNWAAGDQRFGLYVAGATARIPFDCEIIGFYGLGAAFNRGRVLLGRDQSAVMSFAVGRALAAVERDRDAHIRAGIPLKNQDTLTCQIDNANNNEIDQVFLFLRKGAVTSPLGKYARIFPVVAAGATTTVAHTWTGGNLTPEATLDSKKTYDVLGLANTEATSGAVRLVSLTPGEQGDPRPTAISGLTSALNGMTYFDDVLRFTGDRFPSAEYLDNTAATAQLLTVLIGEHP